MASPRPIPVRAPSQASFVQRRRWCRWTAAQVKLSFDSGYRLDPGKIGASLSPKTRLVSIASPQNPSGVSAPRAAVEALLKLIESVCPEAVLFVDETYREATYGDAVAAESVAALHPRVVTGASVSKALGAPGLRTGWLTVPDAELRSRIAVARMNIVLSGSVVDEALAAVLLRDKETVLGPRRPLLAGALQELAEWCEGERRRIDWVRPDAGALSCLRLSADAFDQAAVERFWDLLPGHDVQLAPGTWFGEDPRVFRLGFGYLPPDKFGPALAALSAALDAALA